MCQNESRLPGPAWMGGEVRMRLPLNAWPWECQEWVGLCDRALLQAQLNPELVRVQPAWSKPPAPAPRM